MAGDDARVKQSLTRAGKRKVDQIHAYGRMQVNTAMARLNSSQRQAVAQGLGAALQACRETRGVPARRIQSDHDPRRLPARHDRPITEMHAAFYARHAGFGQFFESQVATGVAEFAGRQPDRQPCLAGAAERPHRRLGRHRRPGPGQQPRAPALVHPDDGCRGSGAASCWPRPWLRPAASPPPGSGPSRDSMRPASCMNRSASSWCARKPESNGVRRSRTAVHPPGPLSSLSFAVIPGQCSRTMMLAGSAEVASVTDITGTLMSTRIWTTSRPTRPPPPFQRRGEPRAVARGFLKAGGRRRGRLHGRGPDRLGSDDDDDSPAKPVTPENPRRSSPSRST